MFRNYLNFTKNLWESQSNFNVVNRLRFSAYHGSLRQFTLSASQWTQLKNIDFKEFQEAIKDKNVVIIDVREPEELIEYGTLPRSINIPLGEIETTLKNMPKDEFFRKYGCSKPEEGTSVVFSCMRGKRSEEAQLIALKLGYKNVNNFSGGWTEWNEKST